MLNLTTQMNLEDIQLSEINQSQKDKYCMIPLKMRYLEQTSEAKKKCDCQEECGKGIGELLFSEYIISVLESEQVLEVCTQLVPVINNIVLCT